MTPTEPLEQGRKAFDDHRWSDACDLLERADRDGSLDPVDLERPATAWYLSGHDDMSTDAWVRAHQGWQARGDVARAVRCAFWLGFGLVQRGEMARGGGWLARANRMADEHELASVERGYLMVSAGLVAVGEGDAATALQQFEAAGTLGRRSGDRDLSALGLLGSGQALLRLGRAADGLARFDEAMASVTAGEVMPTVAGIVYCAVIESCHRLFDLRRAREWTTALDRWCADQPDLVPYRGQCLVHRAQVRQVEGAWLDADAAVEEACRRLSEQPHPAVGAAHYQLGELRRLRGDLARAEDAYRRAHAAGRDPQPGLALLRLAEGRTDAAVLAIEAAVDATSDPLERAGLLPALAEILAAADRIDEAARAVDELDELAASSGTTMLVAMAARTRGAVLIAGGDASAALAPLQHALVRWSQLGAPYEEADVRVLLARAHRLLDDADRAELECAAARAAFEALGAEPALALIDQLTAGAPAPPGAGATVRREHPAITDRELEVLRLVAAGRTNRQIAVELAISEKTVERHLGNVFTKLGVSNRAAAIAHAYDAGWL